MDDNAILKAFTRLKVYCENNGFYGWDPYDGLNSRVFQLLPFVKHSRLCRLMEIQFFKRCLINFRRILSVPKGYNAKGIALFLQGYCNLVIAIEKHPELQDTFGTREDLLQTVQKMADLLISLQSKGIYRGACWGYNFDWQSKAFYLPKYTPTVVATSFAVEALLSAYELLQEEKYRIVAISSAEFILYDINRIPKKNGFMFSYSPLDTRAVYNASLLASKTLALCYKYTLKEEYKNIALLTAETVCQTQNEDGSFPHSDQIGNKLRDNFHTGFKLESLAIVNDCCGKNIFDSCIKKGVQYWILNFFDTDTGVAKYYDRDIQANLIDLHCFAQSIPTLYKLGMLEQYIDFVEKEILWAITNMQDKQGYFYFQKKGFVKNKNIYMRWPNAWCFYGLSYWFLFK